jgi:hypothetical protein
LRRFEAFLDAFARDLNLALSSPSAYACTSSFKLLIRLGKAHEAKGEWEKAKSAYQRAKEVAKKKGKNKENVSSPKHDHAHYDHDPSLLD